ncbi:hypothetical protein [Streptomyces sp. NPDC046862]|uniref:VMAP-C domain-containing protein n=1 Tax=Streptomyces sp. NPDC046862 TaxID=3154603 RepID=UPI0034562B46
MTGLMVSTEPDNPRSYAIRASALLQFLAAADVLPEARPLSPTERTSRRALIATVDLLSDSTLTRCAERFSRALDLPWNPDTPETLVDLATEHPRGIPVLLDTLTKDGPVATRVRETAAQLTPVRLLTPAEYDELIELLGPAGYADLRSGARLAVPDLLLTYTGQDDIRTLIEDLEDRRTEPGVVPHLLQVVEEVAAVRGADGDTLRAWAEPVAARAGALPGAISQCRSSAASRARARTADPVLRVWLWAEPAADAFHYVIRLYDGHGRDAGTWTDKDTLHSRSQLCAALSEAVGQLDQYTESAGVEFLLEEGYFGLAVDRFPTRAGALGDRAVGLDRPVVIRGQHVPRKGPWQERWALRQHPGAGPWVVLDEGAANNTLTDRRDIACVIACCPPEERDRTLALCRWLGVPVVLWHRGAHGQEAAHALRAVVREDWPHSLPLEVWRQRAAALNDTAHMGAHLALLWEDPRWQPPEPRLSNPTRPGGGAA